MAASRIALYAQVFTLGQIGAVRHAVARHTAAAGLRGQGLADFVLAVNEIASNAIEHGGGSGELRLWLVDGLLCCEVTDRGAGISAAQAAVRRRPSAAATRGRGLWLARQLSDDVVVETGPDGTTVRVTAQTPSIVRLSGAHIAVTGAHTAVTGPGATTGPGPHSDDRTG